MADRAPSLDSWDSLAALEEEIRGEKASTLGRTAALLEEHLAALDDMRAQLARAPTDERMARVAAYNARLTEAERVYWYLQVQREAMGLRNDDTLAALYPLPRRLR
jgi:hypothetical protein